MNVVLANRDYETHMSTEGNELQLSLEYAGWWLSGRGYDGVQDCREIIERYQPQMIFVQDCRDWLPTSEICYRKDGAFTNLAAIGESGIPAFTVLKDAAGWHETQFWCASMIHATALALYYHPAVVDNVAPWSRHYPKIRMHHTIDISVLPPALDRPRRRGLVSGARASCYPVREMAFDQAGYLSIDVLPHPGYGNYRSFTPGYLETLVNYKVHVATASDYGFALRKIIESVACGCTPITNLPEIDILPAIDDALIRIPSTISKSRLRQIIDEAEYQWNVEERLEYARRARHYYDWRVMGQRLSLAMTEHVGAHCA
jgi:hypothetical protein